MAQPGQVIENPAMGARIVFRETAGSTNGELVQFDFYLEPSEVIAVQHVHPLQEERFTVIAGALRGRLNGVEQTAAVGQTVVTPRGTPHVWWNDGASEAHLVVEFRPALQTEEFLETGFAIARRGCTDRHGIPDLLHFAALNARYPDMTYPVFPPRAVLKVLLPVMARVGKLLHLNSGADLIRRSALR